MDSEFARYLNIFLDDADAELIWVAIPSGVIAGYVGSKESLARKLQELSAESVGDFQSQAGDPGSYLFWDGDEGFYLVDAHLLGGAKKISLGLARVRTADVSAFGPFEGP
jgi:hypothetical protein